MTREEEISRLEGDTPANFQNNFIFTVHCAGNAQFVLRKVKEVLLAVLKQDPSNWPSDAEWRKLLPDWFVQQSADEILPAEEERRLQLPIAERLEMYQRWSVGAFVFWFMPDERSWFWWDARIENANLLHIEVVGVDFPFAWESLDWLLRASGALRVEEA